MCSRRQRAVHTIATSLSLLEWHTDHIHHHSPVPAFLWFVALAIIVALLFLRRALKWRYPV
jgi:hypothetical protein